MKSPFVRLGVIAGACLALSVPAMADAVHNGSILRLGGEPVGTPNPSDMSSTVDHIAFTVNTAGYITFDALSWEYDFDNGLLVDVNGDGEYAFIDPLIRLFRDDGDLTADDELGANDDSSDTLSDGSVSSLDSFLGLDLEVGNYILTVGGYYYDIDDAIAGMNPSGSYPVTADENGDLFASDHGDYRVTFTGDVTVVPAPGAGALFAAGLIGIASRRRRNA